MNKKSTFITFIINVIFKNRKNLNKHFTSIDVLIDYSS
jgi:hypothetical protein